MGWLRLMKLRQKSEKGFGGRVGVMGVNERTGWRFDKPRTARVYSLIFGTIRFSHDYGLFLITSLLTSAKRLESSDVKSKFTNRV